MNEKVSDHDANCMEFIRLNHRDSVMLLHKCFKQAKEDKALNDLVKEQACSILQTTVA